MKDGLFECTLTLPPNAAFQRMVGPLCSNSNLAKQLASLEACKKLHELGALSDHLLPFPEEPLETDIVGINKDYASGAGILCNFFLLIVGIFFSVAYFQIDLCQIWLAD